MAKKRDHGGGLDAAVARYGGTRQDWLDLSTGINPVPYPVPDLSAQAWGALPDQGMADRLTDAARRFWAIPKGAGVIAAPGASSLIAQIPRLFDTGSVHIPAPTYNEHAASFSNAGWAVSTTPDADAQVLVHPNNPDGRLWSETDLKARITLIDESFCDVVQEHSLTHLSDQPNTLVLKSFGKFWGLAGLRLGFAIGDPKLIDALKEMLGPWPVSGIALEVGAHALEDVNWAVSARQRLDADTAKLDTIVTAKSAKLIGGTSLFRLYRVDDAAAWQDRLARHHIWTRVFPYASDWVRIGLPAPEGWHRLEAAV